MIKLYSKKTLFVLIILAWPYLAINSNLKTTVVRYFRVQPKIYFKKVGESQVELRTRIFVHCWTWTKTRIFQIRTNLESNSTQLWRVCRSIRIFDWSVREVSNNPIKIEGLNFYWPLWQWRGFKTFTVVEEWVPIYLKLYERFGFASVHHNLSISLNKHLRLWERNKGILAVEKKNMVPISDFSEIVIRWQKLTKILSHIYVGLT